MLTFLLRRVCRVMLLPLLILSAMVGSLVLLVLALVCTSVGALEFYRLKVARVIAEYWFSFGACLLEACGTEIEVPVMDLSSDRIVVLMNHNNRVDWMFFWCILARCGRCGDVCVVLKDSLKKVPFFGWAMQAFCFVFLSRKSKHTDLSRISLLRRNRKSKCVLLVYPEGTDLSESNVAKSQAFAKTKGLEPWKNVLIPKIEGARAAIAALKPSIVVDVTVRFDSQTRPTEVDLLLRGKVPKKVIYRCRTFQAKDVPSGDKSLFEKWLMELWADKELFLEKDINAYEAWTKTHWATKDSDRLKDDTNKNFKIMPLPMKAYVKTFVVNAASVSLFTWALFFRQQASDFRLFCLCLCGLWHTITIVLGGLDNILQAPALEKITL